MTKSGGNAFHGSLFEFLRNTDFDAKGYFSKERSTFQQNQYGGTIGGPIKRNRLFFFGDYQGQHTKQGQDTGQVAVPSLANRTGLQEQDSNQLDKVQEAFSKMELENMEVIGKRRAVAAVA